MWRLASVPLLLLCLSRCDATRPHSVFTVTTGRQQQQLLPPAVWPLPLGSVQPLGWLDTQLRIQASGLAGHLSRLYGDIANSTWFGGDAAESGGLHERAPYWLNGAVPLAYLLPSSPSGQVADFSLSLAEEAARRCPARANQTAELQFEWPRSQARHAVISSGGDTKPRMCGEHVDDAAIDLRAEVSRFLGIVLDLQAPSGWLGGPANDNADDRDQYWPAWDVVYALLMWAEAEPAQAMRVQTSLMAYAAEASRRLDTAPLDGWSSVRWPEWVAIFQRMHDTFDLDAGERALLLGLCSKITTQGYNWIVYFTDPTVQPNFVRAVT